MHIHIIPVYVTIHIIYAYAYPYYTVICNYIYYTVIFNYPYYTVIYNYYSLLYVPSLFYATIHIMLLHVLSLLYCYM